MKKLIVLLLVLITVNISYAGGKTKTIAHRGFWKTEGSAQNSIASLKSAAKIGIYGSEFDVWVTKDDVAVVFHDAKSANGDKIETSTLEQIRQSKLPNGELIPTLEEYLTAAGDLKKIKLIIELKSHTSPQREEMVVEKTLAMVKKLNLEKRVEYITFSMNIGKQLIKLAPKAKIAYLNGEKSPAELKELGYSGLDYNMSVMKKNETWFAQAKELGLTVNVWTVNSENGMKYLINNGVDYITTDNPLLMLEIQR